MSRCYNPDCDTGHYNDDYHDKCPSCEDDWEYEEETTNNSYGYGDGSGYDS